jgi:hypothetical protein
MKSTFPPAACQMEFGLSYNKRDENGKQLIQTFFILMLEFSDYSTLCRLSVRRAGPLTGASLYLKPCAAGRLTRFQNNY